MNNENNGLNEMGQQVPPTEVPGAAADNCNHHYSGGLFNRIHHGCRNQKFTLFRKRFYPRRKSAGAVPVHNIYNSCFARFNSALPHKSEISAHG